MGKIEFSNYFKIISKGLFVLVLGLGIVSVGKAQDYKVPVSEDYEFKDAEDYQKYSEDMIKCTAYLISGNPTEDGFEWVEAMSWMLRWIEGSPDYTFVLRNEVMEYIHKKNSVLVFYFMAGWINDALLNEEDDEIRGNIAGLTAMVNAYQDHPGWKKDKKLKKIIAQMDNNDDVIQGLVRSWFH